MDGRRIGGREGDEEEVWGWRKSVRGSSETEQTSGRVLVNWSQASSEAAVWAGGERETEDGDLGTVQRAAVTI